MYPPPTPAPDSPWIYPPPVPVSPGIYPLPVLVSPGIYPAPAPVSPEWDMLFMYWLLVGLYLGVGLLLVGAVWWLAHVLRRRHLSRQALVCAACGLALCASVGAMVLYRRYDEGRRAEEQLLYWQQQSRLADMRNLPFTVYRIQTLPEGVTSTPFALVASPLPSDGPYPLPGQPEVATLATLRRADGSGGQALWGSVVQLQRPVGYPALCPARAFGAVPQLEHPCHLVATTVGGRAIYQTAFPSGDQGIIMLSIAEGDTLICFELAGPVEPDRLDSVVAMVESLRPAQLEELAMLDQAERPATLSRAGV